MRSNVDERNRHHTSTSSNTVPIGNGDREPTDLTSEEVLLAPAILRSVGLQRSGHTSRAVRALDNTALMDASSPGLLQNMNNLHPPSEFQLPPLPDNAPYMPVPADDKFVKIWRTRIATGAGPGPSMFTGDHGLPLLEHPECLRGLASLVQRIRNGRLVLDDRFKDLLLTCNLVAVPKSDGTPRPIAIGETLYKMAAFLAIDSVKGVIPDTLGPAQFAFLPGGSETASLLLKALLETQTAFSTDLKNAYNELRDVMLDTLFAEERLAPIFSLCLGSTQTQLLFS
jgi:hypothetical protein